MCTHTTPIQLDKLMLQTKIRISNLQSIEYDSHYSLMEERANENREMTVGSGRIRAIQAHYNRKWFYLYLSSGKGWLKKLMKMKAPSDGLLTLAIAKQLTMSYPFISQNIFHSIFVYVPRGILIQIIFQ